MFRVDPLRSRALVAFAGFASCGMAIAVSFSSAAPPSFSPHVAPRFPHMSEINSLFR